MGQGLRRIITGHNDAGRSIIVLDGPPAGSDGGEPGPLNEIWTTPGVPAPDNSGAFQDQATLPPQLEPPSGGVKLRWFTVTPQAQLDAIDPKQLDATVQAGFEAIGAGHARVDTTRHPMMHKTRSVDYIILISGEVKLLLDEDETELKPGDVVVQRGTNHAWVNTGSEPAVLVAVLIDTPE